MEQRLSTSLSGNQISITPAHTIRLILGDQLNPRHHWFENTDPGVLYVLMEVRQETDYVLHHAQKIIAIFAAMRAFAGKLRQQGHRVRYVTLDDPSNRHSITDNLDALFARYQAQRLQWQLPDEWRLDQCLQNWAKAGTFEYETVDTDHFLTDRNEMSHLFKGRKQWLMEHFYRVMRRKWNVLIAADGSPVGGKWNFDKENRKPWPGTPAEPDDTRSVHDHSALWAMIEGCGVKSFGDSQAQTFRWPCDRDEALSQLEAFVEHTLPHFGDYEDAMSVSSERLFHSLLSFALNTKMLHPLEVVRRVEQAHEAGHAPLAAVEGFIRQIIGWREYVRGIYWSQMPGYDQLNGLDHHRPLPSWFWTGQTRMNCLRHSIGQSLKTAHAHHIQRLMVIGNFSLLTGLDPQELHRWYLGIYIDAFEWVELPNTAGMSQWADQGLIATKPYVSSAAYIDRMSDYCKTCHYNKKQKTSDQACPFNALYWNFFEHHGPTLRQNPRLVMAYRQIGKMNNEQRAEIRNRAQWILEHIESL